jgi:hypothetical protein
MRGLNALLRDTTSHLKDDILQNQLEANLDEALVKACNAEKINDISSLETWLTHVKAEDEQLRADHIQQKADAE